MVLATDPLPSATSLPLGGKDHSGESVMTSASSPPQKGRRALTAGWDAWPLSHLNDGVTVMTSFTADVAKVKGTM